MYKSPYFEAASRPAHGPWGAKRDLAAAMRELTAILVKSDASQAELDAATAAVRAVSAKLGAQGERRGVRSFADATLSDDTGAFFDLSPLVGLCNPVAPPMRLLTDDEQIRGVVTFSAAYEGPPGHVHGGFIAAAFDEVLGLAQCSTGNPGMTGRLAVSYRAPTPLNEEIILTGQVTRIDGRKIFTKGTMQVGETVTAEAEGLFVSMNREGFTDLVNSKTSRSDAARGDA